MPGVPSGRACEGCRKQKKKCDEKKPSCSRCARLRIVCVGSGQQRYVWKEHDFRKDANKGQLLKPSARPKERNSEAEVCFTRPSNDMTVLAHAFVKSIKLSADLRYNLTWAYGGFLEDIPRRLGTSEALDASVDAVVTAHSHFSVHKSVSVEALKKYSHALSKLRTYLDDPPKARAPETLCAVMILLICQTFIGTQGQQWTGHAEGAAQILRARRYFTPQNAFERKLLLSLRGPVLFEGLFNKRISLSSEEWTTLIANELDAGTSSGQMIRCLAQVPVIMERARHSFGHEARVAELRSETRALYETFKLILIESQTQWTAIESTGSNGSFKESLLYAHYQRSYGFALAVGIILNCVLSAFDIEDSTLQLESTSFAEEVLVLAEQSAPYRPLGASYMVLCLVSAWAGTNDINLRLSIKRMLEDYQSDFPHVDMWASSDRLEWTTQRLRLRDPVCHHTDPVH